MLTMLRFAMPDLLRPRVQLQSLLLAALPLLGGGASAADASLMQGANVHITTADVHAELQRMAPEARAQMLDQPQALHHLIDRLYLRRAFAAQAEGTSVLKDPQIQYQLLAAREIVMAEAHANRVTTAAKPDSAAVDKLAQNIYKAEPARFEIPAETRARHILIQGATAESRAKAEKLLAELKAGANFEELAKTNSADPGSAAKGGDLGFFPKGRMVKPFEDALNALQKSGDLSGVVQSDFGFHIIRLEERQPAGIKPYSEVRDSLHAEIIDKALKKAFVEEADRLRAQAKGDEATLEAFVAEQKKQLPATTVPAPAPAGTPVPAK